MRVEWQTDIYVSTCTGTGTTQLIKMRHQSVYVIQINKNFDVLPQSALRVYIFKKDNIFNLCK